MSAPNDTVAGALRDGFISRQLSPSLYFNPTGKPVAVKVARPVWSGGQVARPYLSLLFLNWRHIFALTVSRYARYTRLSFDGCRDDRLRLCRTGCMPGGVLT